MKSVLLITWANIKRRKIQTILVAVCIALSALLFSTVIGIGLGMQRPFENLYQNLKASHIVMQFDLNVHDPKEISQWFNQQDEVATVAKPKLRKYLRKSALYKQKEIVGGTFLVEHQGNSQPIDRLDILEGEKADYPMPGEIWIPNHWRNNAPMALGDTILVPTSGGAFPLVISAIVVDPHYSNGLFNPNPAWVGPGTLSMLFPVKELTQVILGVRLHDHADTEPVWARFNIENSYQGFSTLYPLFKQIFQIVYQITGGLLFVFAILGVIVTLIITSSVVSSAIKTDYKMIGMLKTQGFTKRNVISVYVIQFILITCIAVPFGIIGGHYMTLLVFKSLISAIGTVNFDISMLLPSIGTFFAFLIGILIITYRTALEATKIQPVTAIRNNGPPQKSFASSQFGLFKLGPRTHVVFFLALRFLMSNKKRALLLFIGLSFVIFVQLLYVNGRSSLIGLDDNRPAWGFNYCDISVTQLGPILQNQEDFFKEDMEDDDRVKDVVKRGFYGASLPAQEGKAPKALVGIIYDDEMEKVGLRVIDGRHPVFEDELSLGVGSSRQLGLGIGDSIELFMEGQLIPYNITGIYQSLNNLSEGFYMRIEGIREFNPLYQIRGYEIKLKKGEDMHAFKEELIKTYGSAYRIEASTEDLGRLKGILKGIQDVLFLISLLFLGVLFVTVFNDTVLSIREGQRNLGIFKAVGMTPLQLQLALIIKSVIIAVVALIVSIPISLYLIPTSLSQLTVVGGLTEFPYLFHMNYTILVVPFILFLTILSVWIASRRLLKIRPRILVRQ